MAYSDLGLSPQFSIQYSLVAATDLDRRLAGVRCDENGVRCDHDSDWERAR